MQMRPKPKPRRTRYITPLALRLHRMHLSTEDQMRWVRCGAVRPRGDARNWRNITPHRDSATGEWTRLLLWIDFCWFTKLAKRSGWDAQDTHTKRLHDDERLRGAKERENKQVIREATAYLNTIISLKGVVEAWGCHALMCNDILSLKQQYKRRNEMSLNFNNWKWNVLYSRRSITSVELKPHTYYGSEGVVYISTIG